MKGTKDQTLYGWARQKLSFIILRPLVPLAAHVKIYRLISEHGLIVRTQMVQQRRHVIVIKVVLHITVTPMHGP
jgi:hypothetical protein